MKSNPLATRFVAPGRVAWEVSQGSPDPQAIADRLLRELDYRGAIVGPHGSGKSTLLENVVPLLGTLTLKRSADPVLDSATLEPIARPQLSDKSLGQGITREIIWLRMRRAWRSTRLLLVTRSTWQRKGRLLVIDGYEQLPKIVRGVLLMWTRAKSVGLLVTSHRPTILPTVARTFVTGELASRLLDELLPMDTPNRDTLLDVDRLTALLGKHHGNLREVFMELYDELA